MTRSPTRTRRPLSLAFAVAFLALVAIVVSVVAHKRWPQYGIEYETVAMARENLALAPVEAPTLSLADESAAIAQLPALARRAADNAATLREDLVRQLGATPELLEEGVQLALETVARRAAIDPESYIDWVRTHDCVSTTFHTPAHLRTPGDAALYNPYQNAWRFTFKQLMPADITPERFVVEMLRATQTQFNGRAWVREIITDDRALFVEASVRDSRDDGFEYSHIDRAGSLGSDFWMGAIGMMSERTLACGRSLAQVVREDGAALVMHVRIAGLSPNREPIPLTCLVYLDPAARRWRVHSMDIANVKEPVPYIAF